MLTVGVGATTMSAGLSAAVSQYGNLEVRLAKTEALLRATGYSSGYTGDQLDKMARKIALGTLASTDEIRDAIDVMLTFKSVSGDSFERAIELSQDMAVVMGGSAKTAALQLGKALEDPVTGMTALRRSGVSFTQSEKDMVKQLVESNRVLEAQELILQKVNDQLGGAGAAEASGLIGSVDTMTQRWEEMLETIGNTSGVSKGANAVLAGMTRTIEDITYAIDPSMQDQQKLFDELVREREAARERLASVSSRDDLPILPMPFVYDSQDWYDDNILISKINDQLRAMQEARKNQEIAAGEAQEQADAAAEIAAQEREAAAMAEKRAAAQERIAKAMESQLDSASFGDAGRALYNDIFGISEPQRKTDGPVEKNYNFRQAVRAAEAQISSGHAVNADGWLNAMRNIYERAMRDQYHNYDVEGMAQVIKLMEDKAIVQFGDLEKAVAEHNANGGSYSVTTESGKTYAGRTGGEEPAAGSVMEVTGETIQLNMAAETAEAMGEQVRQWLDAADEKRGGEDHGTLTIKVENEDGSVSGTVSGPSDLLKALSSAAKQAAARVS